MKYSVLLPLEHVRQMDEFVTAEAVTACVRALEAAGVDACNVTEHPIPADRWLAGRGHHALDPFVGLSFAAMAGRKIRLHTNLVVAAYRNPFLTAKAVASLDVLSGGRVILGLGAGYMPEEFAALGANFAERGALLDEAIEAMKRAWTGTSVTMQGRHFNATGNTTLPTPAQKPHPPLWIGGNSEKAIRRAARAGDGWQPFHATPQFGAGAGTDAIATTSDLKRKIDQLRRFSDEAGRERLPDVVMTPDGFMITQRERLPTAEAIDRLGELGRIGVTWASVVLPCRDRAQYLENVDWFGREVMPRV